VFLRDQGRQDEVDLVVTLDQSGRQFPAGGGELLLQRAEQRDERLHQHSFLLGGT
jgi:hypothetical protein